ncbi:MAG TPA: hypothetical protein VFT22_05125 [Kofleriaceae bacterium]|nr:hypothetical protein [Kofleriaceae bacterium]
MRRRLLVVTAFAAAGCQSPANTGTTAAAVTSAHEFTCDTTAVTGDTVLRVLEAGAGALVQRPTGEPCRYHLLHRSSSGRDHVLSHAPGMYFVTAAHTVASSSGPITVVCATDLAHHGADAASSEVPRVQRMITGATLVCSARSDDRWSATRTLIDGGNDFAAWVFDVEAGASGQFLVRWVRDSTFEYLSLANTGRPATDGVYETTFELGPDRAPLALTTTQTSTQMVEVEVEADR